jgi:uncharacterized protein (TIGR02246 family)
MTIEPVALLRRYHDALNDYDERTVTAMFATDAIYVSPGVKGRIEGRDAIIAAFTAYFAEHPDQRAIDETVTQVAPDAVRSVWRLQATARSTGKRVTRRGTETVAFDPAGLIAHVEVTDA